MTRVHLNFHFQINGLDKGFKKGTEDNFKQKHEEGKNKKMTLEFTRKHLEESSCSGSRFLRQLKPN